MEMVIGKFPDRNPDDNWSDISDGLGFDGWEIGHPGRPNRRPLGQIPRFRRL